MSDVALELQRHRATNQRARYTTVLFHAQNLNIDRRDSENFRVTASGPIGKGALLLVEQVMCGTTKDLCAMVSTNQYQYEMLCPREIGGDENVMALAKIEANCFHYDPDSMHAQYCVGNSLSCFNHNCNPNAITFFTACTKEISQAIYQNPFVFFSVYAHRDIAPNEEICISYGKMIGHSNKQKSEIRCHDPTCTPEQRALHLERSARDGLVEHLLYIREFVAAPQFAFALTVRALASDGCVFAGAKRPQDAEAYDILPADCKPTRKFLKHLDSINVSLAEYYRNMLQSVTKRLDAIPLDRRLVDKD